MYPKNDGVNCMINVSFLSLHTLSLGLQYVFLMQAVLTLQNRTNVSTVKAGGAADQARRSLLSQSWSRRRALLTTWSLPWVPGRVSCGSLAATSRGELERAGKQDLDTPTLHFQFASREPCLKSLTRAVVKEVLEQLLAQLQPQNPMESRNMKDKAGPDGDREKPAVVA